MVSPVSTPNPAASGRPASNAARVRQRCPFSGWAGRQPVARSMPAPASATTNPWPPRRTRSVKTAMVMSASPARTGSASGTALLAVSPRSPSRNNRCRGWPRPSRASIKATASAPVSMAAALPRRPECRSTDAPASRAAAAVPSREPSSTTITRPTPGRLAAPATVARIRSDSFRAGMTTATSSLPGMGGILGDPGGR